MNAPLAETEIFRPQRRTLPEKVGRALAKIGPGGSLKIEAPNICGVLFLMKSLLHNEVS
jgi:hypothetical protein